MYVAVIGDIVNSKRISAAKRQSVQEMLKRSLSYINKKYKNQIASNFTITLGDEFQALLTTSNHLFEMIDTITLTMKTMDVEIRFGIGLGDITTRINSELSIGADGPAYWYARSAIERIHKEDDYNMNRIGFAYGNHPDVALVNDTIALGEYMKYKWTQSQLDLLAGVIEMGTYTENFRQVDLADTMQLQPKALHKRVSISGIKMYLRSRIEIEKKIARLQDGK
ncbi:SatD family protein [Jeotgalibaca sp. A127]|uniref:SatD family protein n=1 Tax=Jeotgalibaca sp. A127 TaxID=3457324 RepID=UPI003FD115EE